MSAYAPLLIICSVLLLCLGAAVDAPVLAFVAAGIFLTALVAAAREPRETR